MAEDGLVVGIDTHMDVHVAAVLDRLGRRLGVQSFPATDSGNAQMTRWLDSLGTVTDAGVEGTGSYGYRLARALTRHGIQVREINCPDRSRRRRRGKSDPVDAENAARAVLAGEATAVPKDRRGAAGELRLLVITRRSAVKARTQASNQIKAFLLDAADDLRTRLRPLRKARFARACAALDPGDGLNRALASLGRRWLALDPEARELEKQIIALVAAQARLCSTATASAASPPPSSWSPRAPTPAGCAATRPWPPSAAPARSRHPQARPAGTGSTAAATAPPAAPCGPSPTSA